MHWFRDMVDHWQTLIAGGIALLVGVLAFVAALLTVRAINKQVVEARQGGDQQVAAIRAQVSAIEAQIADQQARDKQLDERQLNALKWSIRAEGRRLETAAALMREALPSVPGWASRAKEQLIIESG